MKSSIYFLILSLFSTAVLAQLPKRGSLMDSVQAEFGTPVVVSPAVGEPPITRWQYETFTVIFEYEHVVHAFPRNNAVETLSAENTDGLVLPEQNATQNSDSIDNTASNDTSADDTSAPEPFSDEPPETDNDFFNNTPDLIN